MGLPNESVTKSAKSAASSVATHIQIAIVGAGPRGTSALERLCASVDDFLTPDSHLTVHVIDPSPPGPGRVWRRKQAPQLLMNTVTSQMTLFTDDSVICDGPIRPGPSLYEWAKMAEPELGPDDYAGRSQYGGYLEWVFGEVLRRTSPNTKVEVHNTRATRLDDEGDGKQTLVLSNGKILSHLHGVILAQGHLPLLAPEPQQVLTKYAQEHGLHYYQPSNPADVDLSVIAPGEGVLLRGLGLNFFDYMALFTTSRGGEFIRDPGHSIGSGLRYRPSGKEPRLIAGSRRGIPYQARGDNGKGAFGRHQPLVFTDEVIDAFRRRADMGLAPDFMSEVWPLVAKEVEGLYYERILGYHGRQGSGLSSPDFREKWLATPHDSPQESQLLDRYHIPKEYRWSWERIQLPYKGKTFPTNAAWKSWLLSYLKEDAEEAALGNAKGALKAAEDVMRDLRNELRQIVDHDGLLSASRRDHLDKWYTPLNAFLSIGPPRQRVEQMVALIEAGVLQVLGPGMKVKNEDGAWMAEATQIPDSTVRATNLIEARLPEPDLRTTQDDLLAHLLKTGQCRPHVLEGYESGGLDVTLSPCRIVDSKGQPHKARFAVGVPTEGVHWVTAAGARPGVNSVTLTDTDAVARAALEAATSPRKDVEELNLADLTLA